MHRGKADSCSLEDKEVNPKVAGTPGTRAERSETPERAGVSSGVSSQVGTSVGESLRDGEGEYGPPREGRLKGLAFQL